MKRIYRACLSLTLSVLLLFTAVPFSAQAAGVRTTSNPVEDLPVVQFAANSAEVNEDERAVDLTIHSVPLTVPTVSLLADTMTFEEGQTADFLVRLSAPSTETITVDYQTSENRSFRATAGEDYEPVSGTLTFLPGETSQTIHVKLLDDTLLEEDIEYFTLTLSNSVNASVVWPYFVNIYIADNEGGPKVFFSQSAYSVPESQDAIINLNLSAPLETPLQVEVESQIIPSSIATLGQDYLEVHQWVTFNPGETYKTFTVDILEDSLDEPDETIFLTFFIRSSGAGYGLKSQAFLTILDNDPISIQLAQSSVAVTEGQASASLAVTLSQPVQDVVTVDYQTSDVSAAAGLDYTAASGTLTFAPGQTSQTITVNLWNDMFDEDNEIFSLALSNPVNAKLGAIAVTQVFIQDNDDPPTIAFPKVKYSATESQGTLNLGFNLSYPSGRTIRVTLKTGAGTATAGQDYTPLNEVITFNPGQTSQTVTLQLVQDDDIDEKDETLRVLLSSPSNAVLGSPTEAEVVIQPVIYQVFLPAASK